MFLLSSICVVQVRRMADDTGLDFSDQIGALENKYQQVILICILCHGIIQFFFLYCSELQST